MICQHRARERCERVLRNLNCCDLFPSSAGSDLTPYDISNPKAAKFLSGLASIILFNFLLNVFFLPSRVTVHNQIIKASTPKSFNIVEVIYNIRRSEGNWRRQKLTLES